MADYTYTASPALDKLKDEIRAAAIVPVLVSTSIAGDQTTLSFDADLSTAEQATLDAVVSGHVPGQSVREKIAAARHWAHKLMDEYQELMISEGIIQAGKAHEVAGKLASASVLAGLGNLYALDAELSTVVPTATFLDQSRIDEIRNKVRSYLTLPLLWDASTSYAVDDLAHNSADEMTYKAVAANTNDQPPSANWVVA